MLPIFYSYIQRDHDLGRCKARFSLIRHIPMGTFYNKSILAIGYEYKQFIKEEMNNIIYINIFILVSKFKLLFKKV